MNYLVDDYDYDMIPCPEGRFLGNKDLTDNLNLVEKYICPSNSSAKLSGSYTNINC
jgi:hypothetical protein